MVSSVNSSSMALYQGQTALSLLTGSTSDSSSIANDILSVWASGASGATSTSTPTAATAPTAPWNSSTATPSVETAVQNAINGDDLIDPSSAKLNAPGGVSSQDYKNLFALYQGLNSLYDLASTAAAQGTADADPTLAYLSTGQLQSAFSSGMSQVQNFLSNAPFTGFNLTSGGVTEDLTSTVSIPNGVYQSYTTGVIGTGDESQPLTALQGNVQFNISIASTAKPTIVKLSNGTTKTISIPPVNIPIDLSNMGSKPRTIDNVVNYINAQLTAAKVSTRFAAANLGSTSTTTTLANGTTSTTAGQTQWGLTVNGTSSEAVTFSAADTAAAVFVSSATGGASTYKGASTDPTTGVTTPGGQTTTATGEQLMKLQTGNNVSGTQPTTITNAGNTSGLPSGAVFADALPEGVGQIVSSATGSDGSVYLLADATGSVNGQPIQGAQGVALLKYDGSGKLLSSKVVAGLQTAVGASIAVNTDGSVAIAGTNVTQASTAASGISTAAATSAFVQVYDSTGAPTWSQSIPALAGTSAATGVVFGANGQVIVSGQTDGSVGGQTPKGDTDEFIQGFDSTGAATFTKQFGSSGTNTSGGLTYDASTNTVYTAGLENSKVTVRSFALNTTTTGTGVSKATKTTATAGATRQLGSADGVAGIGLANGQIVVGGSVSQATITAGSVTQGFVGVEDGFVASISESLTASSGDTVAYVGKSGATTIATNMAVAGGQAYLTGSIADDPSSLAAADATEGFVTGVNVSSGQVSYSTRFAGANGQAAPTAVAVATAGSSVLDRLGLPATTLNSGASNLLVASTAVKAGQSFWVRTAPGGAQTQITITATDTLATLADKINLAIGGQGVAAVNAIGPKSELTISPNDDGSFIELDSQQASNNNPTASSSSLQADALSALGLQSGVIRQVKQINNLTDVNQLREYGLKLPTNLNLTSATSAQHAANALQAAISAVQSAYQDLATPPTMASEAVAAAQNTTGSVPAYLTNEIANLQAGLNKLTGGSSSSSSALSNGQIASQLLA